MSAGPAPVAPGTVQFWSDISCAFATRGLAALTEARSSLGLELDVLVEHRAFPLETASPGHPRTRVALGAVRATTQVGGLELAERVDWALRTARPLPTTREQVLAILRTIEGLDVAAVESGWEAGIAGVDGDWELVPALGIEGSPHIRLSDGTSVFNPGEQDPGVWDELLRRALSPEG